MPLQNVLQGTLLRQSFRLKRAGLIDTIGQTTSSSDNSDRYMLFDVGNAVQQKTTDLKMSGLYGRIQQPWRRSSITFDLSRLVLCVAVITSILCVKLPLPRPVDC